MREQPRPVTHRADRILDVAAELLLRLGYRKVTIEDIARRAGIGKGTVYLHWRTKEHLFQALLLRESIDHVQELLDRLRDDPAEALPHRFVRASFLASMRRPLLVAVLTDDTELIGTLRDASLRSQQARFTERFYALMIDHHLLRDDIPNLIYALQAAASGFYVIDNLDPDVGANLDQEAKADALAHTIRHAFEPAGEPDPGAVAATAAQLCALFEDLIETYRTWIYSHDPARRPADPQAFDKEEIKGATP